MYGPLLGPLEKVACRQLWRESRQLDSPTNSSGFLRTVSNPASHDYRHAVKEFRPVLASIFWAQQCAEGQPKHPPRPAPAFETP